MAFSTRDREFIPPRDYHSNRKSSRKWLFSHLKRHKFLITVGLILQLVNITLQSIVPGLFSDLIAAFKNNKLTLEVIIQKSTLIGILLGSTAVVQLVRSFSFETVGARLERDSRDELYSELLGKSQTFHDSTKVGDIMSRVTQDVRQLSLLMNPGVNMIFLSMTFALVPIIFMGMINPKLLVTPVIFFLLFIYLSRWYNGKLTPWSLKSRTALGKLNNRLNEVINGIQVVRASTEEPFERKLFQQNIQDYYNAEVKLGWIRAKYLPSLFYGIAIMISIFHGITLYKANEIAFEELVEFILLFQLMRLAVFLNSFAISAISMGLAASDRIYEILEGESNIDLNVSGYAQEIKDGIEFNDVFFAYNGSNILENINFKVAKGQTVALVGVTGAGKSTIIKLITRLYDPISGSISIDSVNLKEWSIKSLRSQTSIVEQDVFLFSRTISENIKFGLSEISQDRIIEAAKIAQAHNFIMELPDGYDTVIGERGNSLSGGQKQRIAIARAIVRDPKILILDDSTSAIDSKTEDEINQAIKNVISGRIAFIITHRIAQIRRADHIILLDNGKIIDQGNHEYLSKNSEKYLEIFSIFDKEDV